ncbi:hypothetical protein [Chimaeribacter coloradensis]|uniref:hypothetical protein n=1 Tax=Chimaeribacter coloradensis TaxID=2060068 RepID=UPI0011AF375E|nr:hypothetical protein [Chimaeribacter coloradensis]
MGKEEHQNQLSTGQTSPASNGGEINTQKVAITKNKYILSVGFEVNRPKAFINDTQDLSVDYGHAFFYTTENHKTRTFFSFGPNSLGEPGKITNEYNGKRKATTNYPITEIAQIFRFKITKSQLEKIEEVSKKFTLKVKEEKEFYNASQNDTCAETARDILTEAGIQTPDGSGHVIGTGSKIADVIAFAEIVNPYMWHKGFNEKYAYPVLYYGPGGKENLNSSKDNLLIEVQPEWYLNYGDDDPLMLTSAHKIIHSDYRNEKN